MLPEPAKAILRYVRRLLKGTDIYLNVLTGGDLHETISARSARLRDKGVWIGCILCRFLDLFEQDHCDIARREVVRANVIPEDGTASRQTKPACDAGSMVK